ncbi:A24 family peptidase [Streptomyces sp. NBC_00820]|uniref:prepilin peptidase n=1 Tax=Streptomyces sp. NBC_00820 TaxID=2975842 RepID=UPI002ED24E1A|nr:A24 family peptidase [Streptomyces sp. NBC_00820]
MADLVDLSLVTGAALWGAAAGALLPRAAHRFAVPDEEPWRSHCPGGHRLRGWLGRVPCRSCASGEPGASGVADAGEAGEAGTSYAGEAVASYAPSALLLAAATALTCAVLALATGVRPELAVWLVLAPAGVLLGVVDVRVRRLPDPLTLPLASAALGLLALAAVLPEHAGHWLTALYGALALGGGYLTLFLINPAGMGFGDVKLALGMGAVLGWYGWPTVLLGTFAGFLSGALYGGALVVTRRADRKSAIPFGPFLLAGAFAGLLVGAFTA